MNDSKLLTILLVVVLIIGLAGGSFLGYHFKKCPVIHTGTTTVIDSIIVHDTVNTVKPAKEFVLRKVVDTLYVDSSSKKLDTANCYSFDEKEKDGAYIKAEMCSKEFPPVKPLDLKGSIAYQAGPDSIKIITRVDTVSRTTSTPFYKDWRNYALVVLTALLGGMVATGR